MSKRNLTHYELKVLIRNQVNILARNVFDDMKWEVAFVEARCEEIMSYCEEYDNLPEEI